jgi:hypothetical protein
VGGGKVKERVVRSVRLTVRVVAFGLSRQTARGSIFLFLGYSTSCVSYSDKISSNNRSWNIKYGLGSQDKHARLLRDLTVVVIELEHNRFSVCVITCGREMTDLTWKLAVGDEVTMREHVYTLTSYSIHHSFFGLKPHLPFCTKFGS